MQEKGSQRKEILQDFQVFSRAINHFLFLYKYTGPCCRAAVHKKRPPGYRKALSLGVRVYLMVYHYFLLVVFGVLAQLQQV